jgi:hypothetical protein
MAKKLTQYLQGSSWIAALFAFLGGAAFLFQAWNYAHIQTTFLDEGGYLYVGDLFARGVIHPFQDFGVIRQYAPLAYLIPGQIEAWFGASLQTGRYFSIFCGLMIVIAIWITVNRLGGKWLGTGAVWGMALTPISIQIYSLAITEAWVACLLSWSLLLVLGEKRPLWRIVAGAFLAGIMVMIRQNIILYVPLLVGYIFWQNGKKAGFLALAGCLVPILVIHVFFWPNILEIWATWLPASLTPSLNAFRPPVLGFVTGISVSFADRLSAFMQGIRFHYFTTVGFLVTMFLWPRRNEWTSQSNRRIAIFLATLFVTLALLHAWASFLMVDPYCTFCFTPYLAFFDVIVFLLIAVTISAWKKQVSNILRSIIIFVLLILSAGLGYASFETFGTWLLNLKFPAITRGLDPQQWTPFITIWDILANKFKAEYWTSRLYVPIVSGLIIGIILILSAILIHKISLRKIIWARQYSLGSCLLIASLGLGSVLSPIMGGSYRENGICSADSLQANESIGKTLNNLIPAGSQVFWNVRNAVPLLYAPHINIYYPQIYAFSTFAENGDSEQLLKFGYFNEKLASQWWENADYIVTETNWAQAYQPPNFNPSQYEISQTLPPNPCAPQSFLLIYHKKP